MQNDRARTQAARQRRIEIHSMMEKLKEGGGGDGVMWDVVVAVTGVAAPFSPAPSLGATVASEW